MRRPKVKPSERISRRERLVAFRKRELAIVVDASANSIFPDISSDDRAAGRVSLSRLFSGFPRGPEPPEDFEPTVHVSPPRAPAGGRSVAEVLDA
jgi:hypothetical protein